MKTSTRVIIVIHLSLVFWFLAWACLRPPLDDYYRQQTIRVLHEAVELTPPDQEGLSWDEHIGRSTYLLVQGIPPFTQAWVAFSLAICLLLLFRITGARQASWLLPLLAILYSWNNMTTGADAPPPPDAHLFPQEEALHPYLQEPLSDSIQEQYTQLKVAWEGYLDDEWQGERNFNLARLAAYQKAPPQDPLITLRTKEPLPYLLFYVAWNLFFAVALTRNR